MFKVKSQLLDTLWGHRMRKNGLGSVRVNRANTAFYFAQSQVLLVRCREYRIDESKTSQPKYPGLKFSDNASLGPSFINVQAVEEPNANYCEVVS